MKTTITRYRGLTLETRAAKKSTGKEPDAFTTVTMKDGVPFPVCTFHIGTEKEAIEKTKKKVDLHLSN